MTTAPITGQQIITIDCDGTVYDSWACCGQRDGFSGSPTCAHLREDTIAKVRNIQAAYPGAKLVVLSWRSGLVDVTRAWMERVGLAAEIAAYYIPGSADDVSGPFMQAASRYASQVRFKVATVMALQAAGNEIITGFDDNAGVVDALRSLGVPALQAPRLVKVAHHEWTAGYLGAPEPRRYEREDRDIFAPSTFGYLPDPRTVRRTERPVRHEALGRKDWKRRDYHAA